MLSSTRQTRPPYYKQVPSLRLPPPQPIIFDPIRDRMRGRPPASLSRHARRNHSQWELSARPGRVGGEAFRAINSPAISQAQHDQDQDQEVTHQERQEEAGFVNINEFGDIDDELLNALETTSQQVETTQQVGTTQQVETTQGVKATQQDVIITQVVTLTQHGTQQGSNKRYQEPSSDAPPPKRRGRTPGTKNSKPQKQAPKEASNETTKEPHAKLHRKGSKAFRKLEQENERLKQELHIKELQRQNEEL